MELSSTFSILKNTDWTFEGVDTQYHTHGLHSYPARMIPQIPDKLLDIFCSTGVIQNEAVILDPFCGSGTTLVEANTAGYDAIGFDINPFACELSRAKTTVLPEEFTSKYVLEYILESYPTELSPEDSRFTSESETDVNEGWFPQPQFSQLLYIENRIDTISEKYSEDIERLCRIALSNIVRKISYQRTNEFKRYRMTEKDRTEHNPNVEQLFRQSFYRTFDAVQIYSQLVSSDVTSTVYQSDSREMAELESNSIDAIISSPPYGDHRTTVAYGQFSRDLSIIAHNESKQSMLDVDKTGLGGKYQYTTVNELIEKSTSLQKTIEQLESVDGRDKDALNFFSDFYAVLQQSARVVKKNQPIVWVVSNRTMSRVKIPTQRITRELCKSIGYAHHKTVPREIPTKTLPWKNSPENVEGETGNLMADENILILTAPEQPN